MSQFTLNLLVVGATFALYIGIAIWARAGSTAEFYTANRGVNPVLNGMATGADWMSAASFISMAGIIALSASGGYVQSAYLMGWTGGYVLLALLLAPYLRKFGKFTVPEFIGDRFYSSTARLVAVLCLIIVSVTYVIGQMTGVGVAFSRFLEVSVTNGLLIGAAVVLVYAVLGGMKGITYTQVAQYVVLIVAYTIPAIFISLQLTGNPVPALGLFSDYQPTGEPLLAKVNSLVTDLGFGEYTAASGSTLNMVLFTLSLMIGTAGLPHVIIRFFTVPKVSDARPVRRLGAGVHRAALPHCPRGRRDGAAEPAHHHLPPGHVRGGPDLRGAPRLDAQLGGHGPPDLRGQERRRPRPALQRQGRGVHRHGRGTGLGRQRARREQRHPRPRQPRDRGVAGMGGWPSSRRAASPRRCRRRAGLLLAISSAISHDLIKRTLNPGISEQGELLAARISMAVAIGVATVLGIYPPGFAAQTVALAFGLAASSIFPALMMGIFSKRINSAGAVAGMLSGLIFTSLYIFAYLGWFFIPGTNWVENVPANYVFGIAPTAIGAIGALLNFAVAFAVSAVTKAPPIEVQELVESIRIPRGAAATTVAH